MDFFSATTFGFMSPAGFTDDPASMESLRLMFEETGSDTLLLTVAALQDHTYSTHIDWTTPDIMSEKDIRTCITAARRMGKKVILKAMVNCRDGYWRAFINFFDTYVPCEPQWEDWFRSYTEFNCYLADIAQDMGVELFCVGCEMVGTDRKANLWRQLVAEVRKHYTGLVTYNCDKYQEHNVTWWDCLDVISSSGYYPIDKLDEQFARIQAVKEKFGKPFMFMECGCPCREGRECIPNDWTHGGAQNIDVQTRWYQAFLEALSRNEWIEGVGWWDWSARLYPAEKALLDSGYGLYHKPAAKLVFDWNENRPRG